MADVPYEKGLVRIRTKGKSLPGTECCAFKGVEHFMVLFGDEKRKRHFLLPVVAVNATNHCSNQRAGQKRRSKPGQIAQHCLI